MKAVRKFTAFCAQHGIMDLAQAELVHIAAFVEHRLREHSKPVVNQRLAVLRMLFDWMAAGQVLSVNPAHAMCGPKATLKKGKTPVLTSGKARTLLDSIDTASLPGLRDRALTAPMVYTFAPVDTAVAMRVDNNFVHGLRGVSDHEKT
jgi:integrase/recombinase XerD